MHLIFSTCVKVEKILIILLFGPPMRAQCDRDKIQIPLIIEEALHFLSTIPWDTEL